jgi:hypothetical protein
MIDLTGLGAGADLVNNVINKIWPDKSKQEKAELAAAMAVVQGQLDINKEEAKNPNLFVSGWRPFIGWVCGVGLAYQFLLYPLLVNWFPRIVASDMSTLFTLLGGLLGLGGLRTVEKLKGVSRN